MEGVYKYTRDENLNKGEGKILMQNRKKGERKEWKRITTRRKEGSERELKLHKGKEAASA